MTDRQYRGYEVNMRLTDVADTFEQDQEISQKVKRRKGLKR